VYEYIKSVIFDFERKCIDVLRDKVFVWGQFLLLTSYRKNENAASK